MKLNFSSNEVRNIFAENDYAEYSQLMFDTAKGEEKVSTKDANNKIREIMFSVLGVDENCSRKELRKSIRRHKIDVFEIIEETVENLLVSGWGENPFFNEFVEIKSMADGDTNEFYVPDEVILTVSELSGNHHDLIRQRLAEGQTFSVRTSWYGINFQSPSTVKCFAQTNALNCWNFLKLITLQRKYEIKLSVNVMKIERSNQMIQG